MKVKEIMTKEVISVSADAKISEVSQILTKHGIHGVPVVLANNQIAGIITESDFFIKDIPDLYLPSYVNFLKTVKFAKKVKGYEKNKLSKLMNATAADIMTKECITVGPDVAVKDLIQTFKTKHCYTMPVVDKNKKVIGIVTLADIIRLFK
jgi:CBS-domain-containing membrane protein